MKLMQENHLVENFRTMTKQEKELLLKDLCARLPYKQKVCYKIHDNSEEITETLSGYLLEYFKTGTIAVVKPYLRPMNTMTEEEKEQTRDLWIDADIKTHATRLIDFYNKHHLDYQGLIPMGLALEAPEEMYK